MKAATQIVLTFSPDEALRLGKALDAVPDLGSNHDAILNDLLSALEDHTEW